MVSAFIFIVVILFVSAFSKVGPLEYGLHFSNWNNKMVLNSNGEVDVYTAGRFLIGIGHTFVTFPTNAVTIDFTNDPGAKNKPLQTRTQDGLPVTIEIALQYKLKPDKLLDLYTELNIGYEAAFVRNARDALLEEAARTRRSSTGVGARRSARRCSSGFSKAKACSGSSKSRACRF